MSHPSFPFFRKLNLAIPTLRLPKTSWVGYVKTNSYLRLNFRNPIPITACQKKILKTHIKKNLISFFGNLLLWKCCTEKYYIYRISSISLRAYYYFSKSVDAQTIQGAH